MKTVTILIPVCNESSNLEQLHAELSRVCLELDQYKFKFLFVDDGSTDGSASVIEALSVKDPRIGFLELSRNFGKEVAMTAGLEAVDTDAVIIMDADLQHPPALIPKLVKKWEQGYEIVGTKRKRVQHSFQRKLFSYLFYRLQKLISEIPVEPRSTDFMLLDAVIVNVLKRFTERNRMVRGLVNWIGFKKTYVKFEAPARFSGNNSYSYFKLLRLAVNGLTGFSLFPLRVAGYLGTLITIGFSGLLGVMLVREFILRLQFFTPRAYVFTLNSILIGIVLMSLGLIALYIGNIHHEVTNRPLYIIRRKTGFRDKDEVELKVMQGNRAEKG